MTLTDPTSTPVPTQPTAFGPTPAAPAAPTARRGMIAFILVAAVLAVAAAGLNATTALMQVAFQKQAVPLRGDLAKLPDELGPWVQVTRDSRASPEIEHELGTTDYLFSRTYVDTRVVARNFPALIEEWDAAKIKDEDLRRRLLAAAIGVDPYAVVTIHAAYYTGAVDTVPHIPDRCMVAGGFDPLSPSVMNVAVPHTEFEYDRAAERYKPVRRDDLRMTFTQFQETLARGGRTTTLHVAYFFQVNGGYEHDAITGVRRRLQNLFETHGYFAKIELRTDSTSTDAEAPARAFESFLTHALPELELLLPDWGEVKAPPEAL